MIAALREGFVNAWVLAKDLEAIAGRSGDDGVKQVCKLVADNYRYPVDSVLITPDLRVVGHVNVHEPAARDPALYVDFLRRGRAAAGGDDGEGAATAAASAPAIGPAADRGGAPAAARAASRSLRVTPEAPTDSLLGVLRRRGFGEPSLRFHSIDATAFAGGGELVVTVRIGDEQPAATFELCSASPDDPRAMMPVRTVKLARGGAGELKLPFAAGARFGLAIKPSGGVDGDANAFLVEVEVRPR